MRSAASNVHSQWGAMAGSVSLLRVGTARCVASSVHFGIIIGGWKEKLDETSFEALR